MAFLLKKETQFKIKKMIKFGASMLTWISKWTPESGLYAIEQANKTGYDVLEILLPNDLNLDVKTIKKQFKTNNIQGNYALILPPNCHLTIYPKQALRLLKDAIDIVESFEGNLLTGVLYSAIAQFSGTLRTNTEWRCMKEVIWEAAIYAHKKGIELALEPINRYETYLLTSAQEVLNLIAEIDLPNLGLHLDTFHMNIEERSFYEPIVAAGKHLKHIHICENDRGIVGKGNIRWNNFFEGLSEINYSGSLVLESFSSEVKELIVPTSLWRASDYSSNQLAKESLLFMKKKAVEFGLCIA